MALSLFGRGGGFDSLTGTVWDPLEGFSVLESDSPSRQFARDAYASNTQIDWRESPEAHVFKADVPGLSKAEVKVQVVDGRTLEIGGERKKEEVQIERRYLAPCGANAGVVLEALPPSGECECGGGESAGGRWSSDSNDSEAAETKAADSSDRDLLKQLEDEREWNRLQTSTSNEESPAMVNLEHSFQYTGH